MIIHQQQGRIRPIDQKRRIIDRKFNIIVHNNSDIFLIPIREIADVSRNDGDKASFIHARGARDRVGRAGGFGSGVGPLVADYGTDTVGIELCGTI